MRKKLAVSAKYTLPLIAALVTALLFLVQSLNTLAGHSRDQIRQELERLLGKSAALEGLEVSLWGGLGFSAKEFRISDHPRFAATPLVRARELKLGVSLMQLLVGRIVVTSLTFEDPELQVITDETGAVNLSALSFQKRNGGSAPRARAVKPDRSAAGPNFRVSHLRFRNGRIDFIDRSVQEPAELQVRNVEMELTGLETTGETSVRFTAAFTEGLTHDVRIVGRIGPVPPGLGWRDQPLDLQMQFDSLQIPLLTRAIPFLRNKIPREIEIAGPLALRANLSGSLERPRITDISLKGILFGASDYNAFLTGQVELPKSRAWNEAQLDGKFTLEEVNLANLRRVPWLVELLPPGLVATGPVSIYSRFEGEWETLRAGVLVRAGNAQIRFGNWLHKRAGIPAEFRARLSRAHDSLILHDSSLHAGRSKLLLSGVFEEAPEPRWRVRLRAEPGRLATWTDVIPLLSIYGARGEVSWDIVFDRKFPAYEGPWDIRGRLKLAQAEARFTESGKKIDRLNAELVFLGRRVRVENASFRLGSSNLRMTAAASLAEAEAEIRLWSAKFNPADLAAQTAVLSHVMTNAAFTGKVRLGEGKPVIDGVLSSAEGELAGAVYRDLRADLSWSPEETELHEIAFRTLSGTVRSRGRWWSDEQGAARLELSSQATGINAAELAPHVVPSPLDRIEGRLSFQGQFQAHVQDGMNLQAITAGAGETAIHGGVLRGINPLALLLPSTSLRSGPSPVGSRFPAPISDLLSRSDTPFDTLKAGFTIEQQRLRTDNLLLVTPDYTITGAGWLGADRATRWNGLLVLSPRLTQELQREYKAIRHLLDRRGRLAVPFRVEGKLPNVKMRPESRALAQVLGSREDQKTEEPEGGGSRSTEGGRRDWLPKALEEMLRR
ncbi:MAG TPA: AsmA-like C-terminal region-containing protein [Candidatus Eisenbacteria bacterium]|nr:AsmA-like C-terminal region-containing protein [Candidatus Eisenbacteria bacterium]